MTRKCNGQALTKRLARQRRQSAALEVGQSLTPESQTCRVTHRRLTPCTLLFHHKPRQNTDRLPSFLSRKSPLVTRHSEGASVIGNSRFASSERVAWICCTIPHRPSTKARTSTKVSHATTFSRNGSILGCPGWGLAWRAFGGVTRTSALVTTASSSPPLPSPLTASTHHRRIQWAIVSCLFTQNP